MNPRMTIAATVQRELGLYACRGCGLIITLDRPLTDAERGTLEHQWGISGDRWGHPDAWCPQCWSSCFAQGTPPFPAPPSAYVDVATLRQRIARLRRLAWGCPECGRTEGEIRSAWDHWGVCDQHRTKWLIESRVFSPFHEEREEQSARLKGYREVEPRRLSDRDVDTDVDAEDRSS
jgi:hypothetical protein